MVTETKCQQCGASEYEVGEIARLKEENFQLRLAIAGHLGPDELCHYSPLEELREVCKQAMNGLWEGWILVHRARKENDRLKDLEALWRKWKEAIRVRNEFQNKWDAQQIPDPLEVARECSAMISAKESLEAWQP